MRSLLVGIAVLVLAGQGFAQHSGDIWLGQTSDGQLSNAGRDLSDPIYLPASDPAGALGGGWAANDPGFDHVTLPEAGVFPLSPSANLSFEVVSMTPGLRLISPDLGTIVTDAGQSGELGGSDLHVHWTFHVHNPEDPQYEGHAHYECTFRVTDSSGSMATSEPITIVFQTEDVLLGDVDLDGTLTPADLDAFYVVLADTTAASSAERVAADVNLDGIVTEDDICPLTVTLGLEDGFVRADANEDQIVNIADAVTMLSILFAGGDEPTFAAALDANSDTQFDIADSVFVLGFLFTAGTEPAAPFPLPGCP